MGEEEEDDQETEAFYEGLKVKMKVMEEQSTQNSLADSLH
jgi:hypothetical protein